MQDNSSAVPIRITQHLGLSVLPIKCVTHKIQGFEGLRIIEKTRFK